MYEVKILKKEGSMNNELFEEMAKNGDITSTKVTDALDKVVTLLGYAECEIKTDDKEFTMNYYATSEYGILSSGSNIFHESITRYYGKVEKVRITSIKTKKGNTYKAVPELAEKKNEPTTNEELPFNIYGKE